MREDGPDRAAQVAHVLHGQRPADAGEPGCMHCHLLLCPVCEIGGLCAACHEDEYEQQRDYDETRAERLEDERRREYQEWEARNTRGKRYY